MYTSFKATRTGPSCDPIIYIRFMIYYIYRPQFHADESNMTTDADVSSGSSAVDGDVCFPKVNTSILFHTTDVQMVC